MGEKREQLFLPRGIGDDEHRLRSSPHPHRNTGPRSGTGEEGGSLGPQEVGGPVAMRGGNGRSASAAAEGATRGMPMILGGLGGRGGLQTGQLLSWGLRDE